ncbi:S9 family peptidase [Parvularcula marina]|uniref:S9 family peptidase n=1 Tax=Parvularcula marina TaxID=2292771 RepID=A0A371R8E9_9PROT|nr:S9 family peptidase [Parvularcula marina]RFB01709.1 S9 family peptidase [Parvularcula marina]
MTRLIALGLAVSAAALTAGASAKDLTIEALHDEAGLSGPSLRGVNFSPDGRMITMLRGREDDARTLDLWAYDVETGESRVLVRSDDLVPADVELSEEEKNRRERQRIYDSGIVSYQWDDDGKRILFPLGGDVFLYDLAEGAAIRVTDTPDDFETDPKVSPDGNFVSYVRNDEVFVYELASGRERQVTKGAGGTIRNGVSEFVAQEELGRNTGYWWSGDDEMIVFAQIDESPVDIVERLDFTPEGSKTISQRYPFAGTDNVKIKLGITTPKGKKPKWIDLGENEDIYVATVRWHEGSPYVFRLSRDQKTLDVLKADPKTGKTELVFSETSDTWVNLRASTFRSLDDGGFLWLSERDGFNHIYRYDADGKNPVQLTKGEWPVTGLSCLDEEDGEIYFSGWMETAAVRHIYRTTLDGSEIEQVTTELGWHSASFGEGCEAYIHRFSSQNQPPQAAVMGADGTRRYWLLENALNNSHPYTPYLDSHLQWEFGQIEAEDGQMMDYQILKPATATAAHPAPAMQLVYGGPGVQRVRNVWGNAYAQLLADKGYVVFMLDNRGAFNRGKAFEDVIYHKMGQPEVIDQAAGTAWLTSQDFVDGSRIGVQGWSYGGYMTLMMLGQRPDLYKAGASGAPVSDWRTYDTAYTERYMGDPREVAEAYDASSVITYAEGIKDDALLLIHGMADDNVIFQNAIDVMAALQQQDTDFKLMTYPGEKHGFRDKENKIHRDRTTLDFLDARLKPGE